MLHRGTETKSEGDLLPGAGVTFTTGRESNATHNETVNDIQTRLATKNQLPDGSDPSLKSLASGHNWAVKTLAGIPLK